MLNGSEKSEKIQGLQNICGFLRLIMVDKNHEKIQIRYKVCGKNCRNTMKAIHGIGL